MSNLAQPRRRRPIRFLIAVALLASALVVVGHRAWTGLQRSRLLSATYAPAPEGMILVPPGEFLMGSDDPGTDFDVPPLHPVFVPAFYIDRHEVTNREYKMFKADHEYPKGEDDFPATHIFKHEAEAYAAWMGKRLPTGAEWEKAARGTDGRRYPWGNDYDRTKCNLRPEGYTSENGRKISDEAVCRLGGKKMAVGQFPEGASPYGVMDMCGNAWEWVSDVHETRVPFEADESTHRTGIIRGGAHGYGSRHGRTYHQGFEPLNTTCNDVGFRCALDALPQKTR